MKTFSYSGAESSGVVFPLGGIGTGSVGICSNGSLKLDEICNSFGGSDKSGAFFALKSETVSGNASVRIIEARAENLKEKSSDSRGNALLACGGGYCRAWYSGKREGEVRSTARTSTRFLRF